MDSSGLLARTRTASEKEEGGGKRSCCDIWQGMASALSAGASVTTETDYRTAGELLLCDIDATAALREEMKRSEGHRVRLEEIDTFSSSANPVLWSLDPVLKMYRECDKTKVVGEGRSGSGEAEYHAIRRSFMFKTLAVNAYLSNRDGDVARSERFAGHMVANQGARPVPEKLCGVPVDAAPLTHADACALGKMFWSEGGDSDACRWIRDATLAVHDLAKLTSVCASAELAADETELSDWAVMVHTIAQLQATGALPSSALVEEMKAGFASGFELAQFVQGEAPAASLPSGPIAPHFWDHFVADTAGVFPNAYATEGATTLPRMAEHSSAVMNASTTRLFTKAMEILQGTGSPQDKVETWALYRLGDGVVLGPLLAALGASEDGEMARSAAVAVGRTCAMARIDPCPAMAAARQAMADAWVRAVEMIGAAAVGECMASLRSAPVIPEYSPELLFKTAKDADFATRLPATLCMLAAALASAGPAEEAEVVRVPLNGMKEALVGASDRARAATPARRMCTVAYTELLAGQGTAIARCERLMAAVAAAIERQRQHEAALPKRWRYGEIARSLVAQTPLATMMGLKECYAVSAPWQGAGGVSLPGVEWRTAAEISGDPVGAPISLACTKDEGAREASAACMAVAMAILRGAPKACRLVHMAVDAFELEAVHDPLLNDIDDYIVLLMYNKAAEVARAQGWDRGPSAEAFYTSAAAALARVEAALRGEGEAGHEVVSATTARGGPDARFVAARPGPSLQGQASVLCIQASRLFTNGKPSSNVRAADDCTAEEHRSTTTWYTQEVATSPAVCMVDFQRTVREGRLLLPETGCLDDVRFELLPTVDGPGRTEAEACHAAAATAFATTLRALGLECTPAPDSMADFVVATLRPYMQRPDGGNRVEALARACGKYGATYLADARAAVAFVHHVLTAA